MSDATLPDFASAGFLEEHIASILAFYEPRARDPEGGFFQTFTDTGEIYDAELRHLVSSTRFVFNYGNAYTRYNIPRYKDWAAHGLAFLRDVHRQPTGHYAWELRANRVTDGRAMAYGHAFVMLAGAAALNADIEEGEELIDDMWEFLENHFWEDEHQAYADERDQTLELLDPYRGQNANMHCCEALIAAWGATENSLYIERAAQLANRFSLQLADVCARYNQSPDATDHPAQIWEHYTTEWEPDMNYNKDKPDDLFKPWGFQPGHQLEWAKLLMQLSDHLYDDWLVERAELLYRNAMRCGWDNEFGGLVYGYAPDGSFSDAGKYFWVHAEGFAAAWRLYRRTANEDYLKDYEKIWAWSWNHLIDHEHGAWFRVRHRDGSPVDNLKSPPGKTDYHTLGACWDVLGPESL